MKQAKITCEITRSVHATRPALIHNTHNGHGGSNTSGGLQYAYSAFNYRIGAVLYMVWERLIFLVRRT